MQQELPHTEIALVIVLYKPKDDDLDFVLHLANLYHGCIVDNSDISHFDTDEVKYMHYISLRKNVGIAEAQNIALQYLLKQSQIQYFIFTDQDSRYKDDYPLSIVQEYKTVYSQLPQLSALGPTIILKDIGEELKSVFHHDHLMNDHFIARPHIISSGCCIHRKLFEQIGLFESNLFIDFVDDEWCWRAASKGYICGISPHIKMFHKIGQKDLHIGKYIITVSAPFRYYYQYRNYLLLVKRKYVPWRWRISYAVKYTARFIYFPIVVENGFACWKYMLKGIRAAWFYPNSN